MINKFDKRTKNIDLGVLNNGSFFLFYSEAKRYINAHLKKAKLLEVIDKEKSLIEYELTYNKFTELEAFLVENEKNICWARAKYFSSSALKIIAWLIAAIISGFFSSVFFSWDKIFSFFGK